MEVVAIISLSLLLIGTNALWGYVVHKLIDKLMSRDFWSYQQSKVIPKAAEAEFNAAVVNTKTETAEEERFKKEMHRLDGLVEAILPL